MHLQLQMLVCTNHELAELPAVDWSIKHYMHGHAWPCGRGSVCLLKQVYCPACPSKDGFEYLQPSEDQKAWEFSCGMALPDLSICSASC